MNESTNPMDLTTRQVEEAVIAALLSQTGALPEVAGWMKPQMFRNTDLAFIYEALLAQYERGEQPDYITTEAEMRRIDSARYEKVGGVNCLGQAFYRIRYGDNLPLYAAEVKRRHLLHTLYLHFTSLAGEASQPESDPEELMAKCERELMNQRECLQTKGRLSSLADMAEEVIEQHERRISGDEKSQPIFTGFSGLDSVFGGLHRGELYVLAGRPSDGKTAVALQIGVNAALAGKQVCFFNMEMTNLQLLNRLFAGQTDIPPEKLRMSILSDLDLAQMKQKQQEWKQVPFYLDYTPGNTVENIRAQVLLKKRQEGCDAVIIDYLHVLEGHIRRGDTPDQVIGRMVKAIKNLALEAECTILLVSQMNREIEKRADKMLRPIMSDLRDSGVIEQQADGVIFVTRPERHGILEDTNGQSLVGVTQLIIRKNRHGAIGTVNLKHNNSCTKYTP